MKNEKERHYRNHILATLLRHDIVTISMLAGETGIGERSMSTKLDKVDAFLQSQHLGAIVRKPHVGLWLEATEQERKSLYQLLNEDVDNSEYVVNQDLRRGEMLRLIFKMKKSQPLTLAGLSQKLYLSQPTAKKSFQSAVAWFAENGIRLQAVQNKGISLETEEANYRRVLQNYLLQNFSDDLPGAIAEFLPGVSALEMRQYLVEEENLWRLEFSDYSFREMWLYLCISVYRFNAGYLIERIPQEEEEEITKHKEFEFASGIAERLKQHKDIALSLVEVMNMAKVILCSGIAYDLPRGQATDDIFEYDAKLRAFIDDIITTMSVVLDEDLTEDEHLREGLLQHLRPAIFRMRYGYEKVDDQLDFARQEYKNVYRAAWSTSTLFEDYFNVKVTEDELLYITLYIEVALERRNRPLKAALVVQSNDIHAQLTCMKIRKAIPRITELEPVSLQSFRAEQAKPLDVIFLPYDLPEDRLELPPEEARKLIHTPRLFTDEGELALKQQVRGLNEGMLRKEEKLAINSISLLDPELMFLHLDLTGKEDIIHMMVKRLVEGGCVQPDYYDSVMEREKNTTTAIGNGVAIPHGFSSGVIQSKVCICTLNRPIRWNDEMVDVIFLLAVKTHTLAEVNNLRQFYKYFIQLMDTTEKVNKLRSISNGPEMYKYLIS